MRRSRGQVLPLWIMAMLAMFAVLFFIIDSADSLYWQIRAQNAADAAASAAVSVQAQRFNQMGAELYALSLEEYRIKRLTDDLEVVSGGSGGCIEPNNPVGVTAGSDCRSIYSALRIAYAKALNRYTNGVQQFAQLTSAMTFDNVQNDMRTVVATIGAPTHCGKIEGGDCAFAYSIFEGGIYPTEGWHHAYMDSNFIRRSPCCDGESDNLAPVGAEVIVCHSYTPVIANFIGFRSGTRRAIARGSFADGVVTSEWFQPGFLINKMTGRPFQPPERYSPAQSADGLLGRYDWYQNAFNSASWTADPVKGQYTTNGIAALGETDRYVQWWAPVLSAPKLSNAISATSAVPCT